MTFIKNTGVQWALGIILLVQGMALSQQSTENELGNSKADSLYQLVNSALARGEMDLVLETYPVLIEELKLIDDTARWIEALRGLGEIQFFRGMYEPALENIITEARLLSIQGNLNLLAIKLNRRGSLYHRLGRVDSAKYYLDEGLALAREVQDTTSLVFSLGARGFFFSDIGDYDASAQDYFEALDLKEFNHL